VTARPLALYASLALVALAGTASPGSAQVSTVTTADIQRLQDRVFDVSRDISQLQGRDAALATSLQTELDDARDEVVYLKVKLRKNEYIARSEYSNLRDKIDNIKARALGERTTSAAPPPTLPPVVPEPPRTAPPLRAHRARRRAATRCPSARNSTCASKAR
jgi:TolA-binding protein